MQKITFGRFACYLTKSWIESTSGSKPTLFRDFIQRAFITAKQFLGILYTVSIQKFFQVTPKILVHYIGEISLIRIDQLAQFLQRKSGIQKHLTNFQLIKDTFIYSNPLSCPLFPVRQTVRPNDARLPWKAGLSAFRNVGCSFCVLETGIPYLILYFCLSLRALETRIYKHFYIDSRNENRCIS